jgi:hypothetical protein
VDGSRITVFVVPRSEDRRPRPSLELKNIVLRTILERRPNVISSDMIRVSDPPYREISVTAEVQPVSIDRAAPLEKDLLRVLERYLHPLTGGEGSGWEFGRGVHISDVYSLLEGVDGVDHVTSLRLNEPILLFYWDEVPGGPSTERLLRYLNQASGLEWVWGARVGRESPRLIRVIDGSKYFTLSADTLGTQVEVALGDVFFGVLPMKNEQGRLAVYQEQSSVDVGGSETVCSGTHRVTVRTGT